MTYFTDILDSYSFNYEGLNEEEIQNKCIELLVTHHYVDGLDEDIVNEAMHKMGIKISKMADLITAMGKSLGLILSKKELHSLVKTKMKGKEKPQDVWDVIDLALDLNLPAIDNNKLLIAVQDAFGTEFQGGARYKSLRAKNDKSYYGRLNQWVMDNPFFTPNDLINSGCLGNDVNRMDYFDEMIAFQKFFQRVDAKRMDLYKAAKARNEEAEKEVSKPAPKARARNKPAIK